VSEQPGTPPGEAPPPTRSRRRGWGPVWWQLALFLAMALLLNYWVASRVTTGPPRISIPYSPTFLQQVEAGNVASVTSKGTTIDGTFKRALRYPPGDTKATRTTLFATEVPAFADTQALAALLQRHDVVVTAKSPSSGTSWFVTLLLYFAPTLLFIGLLVWLFRSSTGGAGGSLMSFGRSKARRVEGTETGVSFEDVAGIDEAKAELAEIVDFLKSPEKYRRLGGRIPRGVLLTGPPGTGKTLLARAVAGEAAVPFFSMSASEFIEMLVGVGASRVRDLFSQAKAEAPAIVFIDELDAVGRSRGGGFAGFGGGHDEREQTLNQILTEMDGFDSSTGVIVLAATNRPDVLDPALLRPGRFDRRVSVQPPDLNGRRLILGVHTRGLLLADDVDLGALAATTPGMVGADLANLANEAALLAAHRDHERVEMADFSDALEKILLGTERKIMLTPAERERTAYHEAGHAVVAMLTPGADPVRKVSIIPRSTSLGVTFSAPTSDRFNWDEQYLHGKIATMLGGRAAEEVVFGNVSSGAESDIQQLTELVRVMVGRWGMSPEIGPITVLPPESESRFFGMAEGSPEQQRLVEHEVHRIVEEAHAEVRNLLEQHRDQLTSLALALLEHETLDESGAYAAAGVASADDAVTRR